MKSLKFSRKKFIFISCRMLTTNKNQTGPMHTVNETYNYSSNRRHLFTKIRIRRVSAHHVRKKCNYLNAKLSPMGAAHARILFYFLICKFRS